MNPQMQTWIEGIVGPTPKATPEQIEATRKIVETFDPMVQFIVLSVARDVSYADIAARLDMSKHEVKTTFAAALTEIMRRTRDER